MQGKQPARKVSVVEEFLGRIDGLLALLIRVGAVVATVSLAYLLWGLLSDKVALFTTLSEQDQHRILGNLQTTARIFLISVVVLAGSILLRHYTDNEAVTLVVFIAFLCWLGLPFLVKIKLESGGQVMQNDASSTLVGAFTAAGQAQLAMLAVLLLRWVVRWIRSRRLEQPPSVFARQPSPLLPKGRKASLFSPCWHLPYCREFLLSVCGAFQAKVKCWKFGRGCMCDPDMFAALMRDSRTGVKGKERAGAAYLYQTVQDQMKSKWKGDKPPCKTCFIYLEHQRLKHQFLAPLVYPVVGLSLWLFYPTLTRVYNTYSPAIARWWSTISFATSQPGNPLEQATPLGGSGEYTIYAFLFLFGLLLLTLTIRLLEFVVLRLKW